MKIEAEKVNNNALKPQLEKDGCFAFTKKRGTDFKILQLTDVHLGGSVFTRKKDANALNAVKRLIEYSKPDLVAFTGDNCYPMLISSGTCNNMRPSKMLGELMEQLGVPWAMVYGNHDSEIIATHTKQQLTNYFASLDTCLFKGTAKGVSGDSNYVVKLKNDDGTLNNALVFIDSNAYEKRSFFSGFDIIHDDEVEWYKSEILRLNAENEAVLKLLESGAKKDGENADQIQKYAEKDRKTAKIISSLAFFHIPFLEFRDAWWALQEKSPEARYFFGAVLEHDQYFGTPHEKGKMFDTILELGSTKGVFVGHDHLNTLSMEYKGVRLTYGMSIDYLAYHKISKKINQRGGTLITIGDDGSFDCSLLPLTTVTGAPKGGGLRF